MYVRLTRTAWCKQGIVGRGVLVDFASYAARHQLGFNPLGRSTISLDTIKQILEESKTVIRRGDILAVRTGKHTYFLAIWHLHTANSHKASSKHTNMPRQTSCIG